MATQGQEPAAQSIGPKDIEPPENPQDFVLRKPGTRIVYPYSHDLEVHKNVERVLVKDAIKQGLLNAKKSPREDKKLKSITAENILLKQQVAKLLAEKKAQKKPKVVASKTPPEADIGDLLTDIGATE